MHSSLTGSLSQRVKIKGYVQTLPKCDTRLEGFWLKPRCLSSIWTTEVLFKPIFPHPWGCRPAASLGASQVLASAAELPRCLFVHLLGDYLAHLPKTFPYYLQQTPSSLIPSDFLHQMTPLTPKAIAACLVCASRYSLRENLHHFGRGRLEDSTFLNNEGTTTSFVASTINHPSNQI